jgi:GT2 family glycosyltransferase
LRVKATVIVPTYRDWDNLVVCLRALAAQDIDSDVFEVIVANNNPEAAVPDFVQLEDNMRVVWVEKPGSYAARNAAMKLAQGKFVFFTDSDCQPARHWVSSGLAHFEADGGCQRIAGRVKVSPASGIWNGWSAYDSIFRLRQEEYVPRGAAVTANLAVRKSVFEDVGPFNEERFSGSDMDWNRRASAAGVPIVLNNDMWVLHPARETYAECASKVRRIAGARFVAKAGKPVKQRMPRLKYVLPSVRDSLKIMRTPSEAPSLAKLAAMCCHYAMGWVYNAEIIRLGFAGGKPNRS